MAELPLEIQSKLLRVIEQGEYMRVGETVVNKVDTKIITETSEVEKEYKDEVTSLTKDTSNE